MQIAVTGMTCWALITEHPGGLICFLLASSSPVSPGSRRLTLQRGHFWAGSPPVRPGRRVCGWTPRPPPWDHSPYESSTYSVWHPLQNTYLIAGVSLTHCILKLKHTWSVEQILTTDSAGLCPRKLHSTAGRMYGFKAKSSNEVVLIYYTDLRWV